MDRTIYQIIKQTWLVLKMYIQNAKDSDKESYWDGEGDALHAIVDSTEGQPKYVSQFAYDLVQAVDKLLSDMHREKREVSA